MSKFVQAAQTSQVLSLTALEEASRQGLREADIEHLFLALVLSDQVAGRVLREMGIGIDDARRAVREQHDAQLASLGVRATLPDPGRIVFHETDGYELKQRAADLIGRAGGKSRDGSAAAVLRELVAEPSGLIADILHRLDATPQEVLERLDRSVADGVAAVSEPSLSKSRASGSQETFVPASADEVWDFLADPVRVPEWEVSVGQIESATREVRPGSVWEGRAPEARPDGKPVKIRPPFRRRLIELVTAECPHRVAWRFVYPDAPQSRPILNEFTLAPTTGGTQVTITTSWTRHTGWRRLVGVPLRPMQKLMVWLRLFQTGSAISRAFR
ncbi:MULTISPECIES: SRPBCC family protein [Micrococcales]|uniref:SRPBCC family protein n=1 Tax=Micrococcales TaxID=85006 RepID=UPI00082BA173|nr:MULTISPECIES: Clp protease N-terminal domain-containing protein [Micrococcales]